MLITSENLRGIASSFYVLFIFSLEDLHDPAPQDNATEPLLTQTLVDIPTGIIESKGPFYNCVLHCKAFDWSEAEGDHVVIETSIYK